LKKEGRVRKGGGKNASSHRERNGSVTVKMVGPYVVSPKTEF